MRLLFLVALLVPLQGFPLSREAREFMDIAAQLEPVHCEKRKLSRAIALAEIEERADDVRKLRERFASLGRDERTARLERRLAELAPRLERSSDPEDLHAVNEQRVQAFYRCE